MLVRLDTRGAVTALTPTSQTKTACVSMVDRVVPNGPHRASARSSAAIGKIGVMPIFYVTALWHP